MIQAITLSFEEAENLLMQCSNCKKPIISLHKATSFLKVDRKPPKYYFAASLGEQYEDSHGEFSIDEDNSYVEVAEQFFLMQLAPVKCSNCNFEVGIFINKANEEESRWLAKCMLFDPQKLDFNPIELKSQLINQLQSQIQKQNDAVFSFSDPNQEQKAKMNDEKQELVFTEIIKDSLENIAFYSQMIDQLNKRLENYLAMRKYQVAKRRSEMKSKTKMSV